jgi:hypothetical protein
MLHKNQPQHSSLNVFAKVVRYLLPLTLCCGMATVVACQGNVDVLAPSGCRTFTHVTFMVASRFSVAHTRQSSETHVTTARHDQPQNFPDHAPSGTGTHHRIQSISHRRTPACPPTSQTTSSNFPQRRVGAPTIPTESFQFSNVRMRSSVRVFSRPVSSPSTEQLALTTIGAASSLHPARRLRRVNKST